MSSDQDKSPRPILVNKAISWSAIWNLSEAVKTIRFTGDGEGNIWAVPAVLAFPNRNGNQVVIPDIGQADSDGLTGTNGINVYNQPYLYNAGSQWWDRARSTYYLRNISAINTASVMTFSTYNLVRASIYMVCSAGTATLTVEASADGINFITIDSIAAAAATAKQYDDSHVGTAIALNPILYPTIRITAGAAGAGNTTTTSVALK